MSLKKTVLVRIFYTGTDSQNRDTFSVHLLDTYAPAPRPSVEGNFLIHRLDGGMAVVLESASYTNMDAKQRLLWTFMLHEAFMKYKPVSGRLDPCFTDGMVKSISDLIGFTEPLSQKTGARVVKDTHWLALQLQINRQVEFEWGGNSVRQFPKVA